MENLSEGLLLLLVGLLSVFVVLLVVMGISRWLILLVNRYFPEATSRVDNKLIQEPKEHVSASDSMVIDEVIKKLSQGTFVVKKIEKIK